MPWKDKHERRPKEEDEQNLNDLIGLNPNQIQNAWKSKEAQSSKKSIKFIMLRNLLIILGVFGLIIFLVWNINHKDTVNEGNHPIENNIIHSAKHDERLADATKTCKELLGWRIESVDKDKPMIWPRLKARFDEMHESDGVVTYEQSMPAFDSQFVSNLSQKVTNPYEYYIRLNKMTWTFPDNSCNEDEETQQEVLFKTESSVLLYESVAAYMKNYHASIKQGDEICITLSANKGDAHLAFKSVETTLKMDDNKKKNMSDYFANAIYRGNTPSTFYVDTFTTQWCYSVYNNENEILAFFQQIPQSDAYPNIVITKTSWKYKNPGSTENLSFYQSLIERKMELVREDIGACLSEYELPNHWVRGRLVFDVPLSGGFISLSNRIKPLFMDKIENKEILNVQRCLSLGTVLPTLFNDIPIESMGESEFLFEFEINRPSKESMPRISIKDKYWDIEDLASIEDVPQYKTLLEDKFKSFEDDLSECLIRYQNHRITARFTFEVAPSGGRISLVSNRKRSYFNSGNDNIYIYNWDTHKEILDTVLECLNSGDVVLELVNDIPVRSKESTTFYVTYEVNVPAGEVIEAKDFTDRVAYKAKMEEEKLAMLLNREAPNDPMTSNEYKDIIKASLTDLQNTIQLACHPKQGDLVVKINLDCAKGKALSVNIKGGSIAKTKDEFCISQVILKYPFPKPVGVFENSKLDLPFVFIF